MKKFILVIFSIFMLSYIVATPGCSDTFITNNYGSGPSSTAQLEPDYYYVSTQTAGYSEGEVFWLDNSGQIKTDLPPIAKIVDFRNDDINPDVVDFRVVYGDTLHFISRRMEIKYSQNHASGNPTYPYQGLGIINSMNLFFAYDQSSNSITICNTINGNKQTLPALYEVERVNINGQIELKHNEVVPNPLESNVHQWTDSNYYGFTWRTTAYRLFWWGEGDSRSWNPGKIIKNE